MSGDRTQSPTPMSLILHKYVHKKRGRRTSYLMALDLLNHGATIAKSYINDAINFPHLLECILEKFPEYYRVLPEKIEYYFYNEYVSFFDLMSRYSEVVFLNMIKSCDEYPSCREFLKEYENDNGQTPLHSAAKFFKFSIVKELMNPRYQYLYI